MKYLQKSFSIGKITTDAYRNNYERAFSKNSVEPLPDPLQRDVSAPLSAPRELTIQLSHADFEAVSVWGNDPLPGAPLDPDVAHAVLTAVADAVVKG